MALKNIEVIFKETNILDVLDEATIESTLQVAIEAAANAKSLCPVAEINGGRLRNSIMWKTKTEEGGLNEDEGSKAPYKVDENPRSDKEAIVGFNLDYGIYQEFGTRYMAPQPFLRPSMAIARGANVKEIIKKVQEEKLRGTLKDTKIRESFI
ncbi:HK97-gp10 family putative phage morphogenesis protein [Pseudoalteromonas sp.]|uniref:HK97-gp10 family putative phage morphogenesis protein n=1 Tax=Pseudoalteromonas sp. TaxID=53249 RepID=UPI002632A6F3|nr:HK97-gp10 family putative phage morphogenesis protein [Pseudoalteromonas sp.]MCP4585641.1 hypothetical protein [Pseudoalteromonas sp.]